MLTNIHIPITADYCEINLGHIAHYSMIDNNHIQLQFCVWVVSHTHFDTSGKIYWAVPTIDPPYFHSGPHQLTNLCKMVSQSGCLMFTPIVKKSPTEIVWGPGTIFNYTLVMLCLISSTKRFYNWVIFYSNLLNYQLIQIQFFKSRNIAR